MKKKTLKRTKNKSKQITKNKRSMKIWHLLNNLNRKTFESSIHYWKNRDLVIRVRFILLDIILPIYSQVIILFKSNIGANRRYIFYTPFPPQVWKYYWHVTESAGHDQVESAEVPGWSAGLIKHERLQKTHLNILLYSCLNDLLAIP